MLLLCSSIKYGKDYICDSELLCLNTDFYYSVGIDYFFIFVPYKDYRRIYCKAYIFLFEDEVILSRRDNKWTEPSLPMMTLLILNYFDFIVAHLFII